MPRGFALLAVLWVVAVAGATVTAAALSLRTAETAAFNRLALARARWAAEACANIAEARSATSAFERGDTISLGRDARCAWQVQDPAAGLDVNLASGASFTRLFLALGATRDSAVAWAARLLRGRENTRYADAEHALTVARAPIAAAAYLSAGGEGRVSAAAPAPVLATVDGLSAEAVEVLVRQHLESRPVQSLAELTGLVSGASRAALDEHYVALQNALVFEPRVLLLISDGWVGAERVSPRARLELFVVRTTGRLAVLQRRMR